MTLSGAVYQGETATVSYDKTKAGHSSQSMPTRGERLKNAAGTAEVASFTGQTVTNRSPDHDTSGIVRPPRIRPDWRVPRVCNRVDADGGVRRQCSTGAR